MEENIEGIPEVVVPPPLLDKAWKYFIFGLFVIAAPIFHFNLIELLEPEWQDGKLSSYIVLALLPEASLWFLLLLAYAILSYILLLWNTERYSKSFIIRLGIYSGAFLALCCRGDPSNILENHVVHREGRPIFENAFVTRATLHLRIKVLPCPRRVAPTKTCYLT